MSGRHGCGRRCIGEDNRDLALFAGRSNERNPTCNDRHRFNSQRLGYVARMLLVIVFVGELPRKNKVPMPAVRRVSVQIGVKASEMFGPELSVRRVVVERIVSMDPRDRGAPQGQQQTDVQHYRHRTMGTSHPRSYESL